MSWVVRFDNDGMFVDYDNDGVRDSWEGALKIGLDLYGNDGIADAWCIVHSNPDNNYIWEDANGNGRVSLNEMSYN